MKYSAVVLFAVLCLFALPSLGRDYDLEINSDTLTTNSVFVSKVSATSQYVGTVKYEGEGNETCSWVFCVTRSFRGIVTEHNSEEEVERILTENEGCMLVNEDSVQYTGNIQYAGAKATSPFVWSAEGEFYLNGQLLSGNCGVVLTVTGDECQNQGEFGYECLPSSSYPVPNATEEISPEGAALVFAVDTHDMATRLGKLTLVVDVEDDLYSTGMGTDTDEDSTGLGTVRLLLDGIPNAGDYDFELPLVAPETELLLAAARPNSNYFYAIKSNKNGVYVTVKDTTVQDCAGEPTYGPNCSITANTLGQSVVGETQTFNPETETFCYSDICYFSLVQKNFRITVKPTNTNDELAILYKAKNFPTSTDFDVAMPGDTTFLPDALQTETVAHFAVFAPSGNPFTVLLGNSPNPPPPPPPADDDLPWAWIGVAIALGLISLALITGFAIYTCRPGRTYESIE